MNHWSTKLATAALLLVSSSSTAFAADTAMMAQKPSDLGASHPDYDGVMYVLNAGIAKGYDDGTFRPDITINRAELVKMLADAYYDEATVSGCIDAHYKTSAFFLSDVPKIAWYAGAVCASAQGKDTPISGYPDRTFRPANDVNFAEAAKIIVQFELQKANAGGRAPFTVASSDKSPWYEGYVLTLQGESAIPTSITSLDQKVTRAEIAEIIYRMQQHVNDKPTARLVTETK